MIAQYRSKVNVDKLCQWAGVAKSSLYYQQHAGPRGIKPSTHTIVGGIGLVENSLVVEQMRAVLSTDYCVYGYRKMTEVLRDLEYQINPKKVYRLMKAHHLLCGKRINVQGKRKWVKHRRIEAKRPIEYLCLDIKYVWVSGEKRWYYQLAVMDVYSRRILCWIFQHSVRGKDVIALMRWLDLRFGLKGVIIRNDNGSQFIANKVREVLRSLEAQQEFTHVATPEENAYIEAFHSIQQRELFDRHIFSSFYDAKQHIEKYMHWYNYKRKHGALGFMTPMEKWAQGLSWTIVRPPFEPGAEDLSRPDSAGPRAASALYSLDKYTEPAYLCLTGDQDNDHLVTNLFEKSVQFIGG
ncbi:MAG TPA: IS3 family transposase [Clostridia bacterium]